MRALWFTVCALVLLLAGGCNVFTDLESVKQEDPGCDLAANPCDGCKPANECGGCGELIGPVGSGCGECDSGAFACNEDNSNVVCEGDLGDDAQNACGGCGDLGGAPGDVCGTCDSGAFECDRDMLICRGDGGDAAFNECGGCGVLDPAPGDDCGTCDTGQIVCEEGGTGTTCVDDEGDAALNECGGCEELVGTIGADCGDCGQLACDMADGTLACDDPGFITFFDDDDNDTFGNPLVSEDACEAPEGFVDNNLDCLDVSFNEVNPANINPGAIETPDDNLDNNCDGFLQVGPRTLNIGSPDNEPERRDDETQHSVTLTRTIEAQATEVTRAQFALAFGREPANNANCPGGQCPVTCVNWWEAVLYANELTELTNEGIEDEADHLTACYTLEGCTGIPGSGDCPELGCTDTPTFTCDAVTFAGLDCTGWRLPTEAEWEMMARGGTTTAYWTGPPVQGFGCNEAQLNGVAQHCAGAAAPVAGRRANVFGFFDVYGNAAEWVHDNYEAFAADALTDPLGPPVAEDRVFRGGSFRDQADFLRSASREHEEPACQSRFVGLRVVRSIPPIPD